MFFTRTSCFTKLFPQTVTICFTKLFPQTVTINVGAGADAAGLVASPTSAPVVMSSKTDRGRQTYRRERRETQRGTEPATIGSPASASVTCVALKNLTVLFVLDCLVYALTVILCVP